MKVNIDPPSLWNTTRRRLTIRDNENTTKTKDLTYTIKEHAGRKYFALIAGSAPQCPMEAQPPTIIDRSSVYQKNSVRNPSQIALTKKKNIAMGRSRYKFHELHYPYLITSSVVEGLPLFMNPVPLISFQDLRRIQILPESLLPGKIFIAIPQGVRTSYIHLNNVFNDKKLYLCRTCITSKQTFE